jgi:hypothetical protein
VTGGTALRAKRAPAKPAHFMHCTATVTVHAPRRFGRAAFASYE